MIEETYLKEFDKDNDLLIISFEGDREDIYELHNYARMINSVKSEIENEYCHCDSHCENNVDKIANVENDLVNHPAHYCKDGVMECIDEMVLVFGEEAVMNFCLCNVWKYRYRAADKNGKQDLEKSHWYMNKYKELKDIVDSNRTNANDCDHVVYAFDPDMGMI